jgi:hypothetical protein
MSRVRYSHPTDGSDVMLVVHCPKRGVLTTSYHASRKAAEAAGREACEDCDGLWFEIRSPALRADPYCEG